MALARVKTWSAGEILTASDLNAEFNNILNNARDLISPLTSSLDLNGLELILDADADTSVTADTDDQIDWKINGADQIVWSATAMAFNEQGADIDFRVETDNNTTAFIVDGGLFTGRGAIGLGGAATDAAVVLIDNPALTATAATNIAKLRIENSAAITVPAGVTAIAASLSVDEPNLTATGTITRAVTVYIEAAPTEGGTANHALWIDAGSFRLDANAILTNDGAATITLPTSTDTLVGRDTTDTLTNKTLTSPTINTPTITTPTINSGAELNGALSGDAIAAQAEMETGTATDSIVSPGRQHFHPGHPKCWAVVTVSGGTPTLATNYNITSITDTAQGQLTITIATDFSTANWCCLATLEADNDTGTPTQLIVTVDNTTKAAGSVRLESWNTSGATSTLVDPVSWSMAGLGDQA